MATLLERLPQFEALGWTVVRRREPVPVPDGIRERYSWLSTEITEVFRHVEELTNPGETCRFNTDFREDTGDGFRWNEWEAMSLDAADTEAEMSAVKRYWSQHFPLVMAVKSGYAYFAVRAADGAIVHGVGPEFEDSTVVAASLDVFVDMVLTADPRLAPDV